MDSKILFLFALIPVLASASDFGASINDEGYGKKDDCPHGFHRLKRTNNCYRFSSDRTSWYLARLKCQEMGGYLAIIKDKTESDAITKHLIKTLPAEAQRGDHDFWIGLQDQVAEGYFYWDTQPLKFVSTPTDKSVRFENWQADEPNSAGSSGVAQKDADCVRISNVNPDTGELWKWADWECDFKFFYLCEAKPRNPFRCNTH